MSRDARSPTQEDTRGTWPQPGGPRRGDRHRPFDDLERRARQNQRYGRLLRLEEALEEIAAGRAPVPHSGLQETILVRLEELAAQVVEGLDRIDGGIAQLNEQLSDGAARTGRVRPRGRK